MTDQTKMPEAWFPSRADCEQAVERFSHYDTGKISLHHWRCMNLMAKAYLASVLSDTPKPAVPVEVVEQVYQALCAATFINSRKNQDGSSYSAGDWKRHCGKEALAALAPYRKAGGT